jgi:hypothetical protein
MISLLNLPKPSNAVLDMVTHNINTLQINNSSKKYFDGSQHNKMNCIAGQTFVCDIPIYLQLFKEFKFYITDRFQASIGIFKNVDTSKLSYLPPHIDNVRTLSLNYVISEGGKNVLTTMYKTTAQNVTKSAIQMELYDNLEIDVAVKTVANNWYAIDIQNYHSVDHIENQRVILTLSFNHINYDYFTSKYEHLLVKDWLPRMGSNHRHPD